MITSLTLNESEQWNTLVKSFRDYDVYYLFEYVKAFQINGDGEPMLIYFHSGNTRAINVVIKRDLAKCEHFSALLPQKTYYDIVTPYGYGGFLVEGEELKALQEEYFAFCRESHIVSEFVRFHPLLKNHNGLSDLYELVRHGKTVYIDTTSEEGILSNMISQCRNKIRKAQKNGLEVFYCHDESMLDTFIEIYNETMKKDNASDYYYFDRAFYESIYHDLKDHSLWFFVKKNDEIIAASIFMFCNGKTHYHLSGMKKEFQCYAPINLLLFEASVWACKNGFKQLHLGGGVGAQNDNLYVFKKNFNRNEDLDFYIGRQIFDQDTYDKLMQMRRDASPSFEPNTNYFPKYRA